MTEQEMENRIEEERRKCEKEKQKALSRTLLTIIGVVVGLSIFSQLGDCGPAGQWGGLICIGVMIAGLVWLHNKIIED